MARAAGAGSARLPPREAKEFLTSQGSLPSSDGRFSALSPLVSTFEKEFIMSDLHRPPGRCALRSWALAASFTMLGLVVSSGKATAGAVKLNYVGWTATAPNGYEVQPDFDLTKTPPDNPLTADGSVKVKMIANWSTLDPIQVTFTDSWPTNKAPSENEHFALRMQFKNNTGKDWIGFSFKMIDNNGAKRFGNNPGQSDTLIHPYAAHFHVDEFDPKTVIFNKLTADPASNNIADLSKEDIRGVSNGLYSFQLTDGTIKKGDTWSPLSLDLHDKPKFNADKDTYVTSFTVVFQPLVASPEPSTFALAAVAVPLGLGYWWRKRRRPIA
jgi:hypothetical protein